MLRRKSFLLTAAILCAAAVLITWGQPWFVFDVQLPSTADASISVDGSVVATALSGLCLATFAVVAVMSISSGVLAVLLTIVLLIVAVGMFLTMLGAFADPLVASLPVFTKLTGLLSVEHVRDYVRDASLTPAIFIALILTVLLVVIATFALWNARSWRSRRSSKYERRISRDTALSEGATGTDTIASWDDLSTGIDPTTH